MRHRLPRIPGPPARGPANGGAGEDSHDWGNLLTMMDMLGQAQTLARLCFAAGVLVMAAGLAWGALLLRMQYAKLKNSSH